MTTLSTWNLHSNSGIECHVLSYGAVLQSLKVPVAGVLRDVVLGLPSEADYMQSMTQPYPPFYGAIVGPHAGRIAHGRWPATDIRLEANDGLHHLHGASGSLSRQHWIAVGPAQRDKLTLRCRMESGSGGYPNALDAQVTYTLTGSQLLIEMQAHVSGEMPVNLTQHSYFNLTGGGADIAGHRLRLASGEALVTEGMIPTGRRAPVSEIVELHHSLDQTFILDGERKAVLEVDDLRMTARTNQNCFHVFVGGTNSDNIPGKTGDPYGPRSGICLENQGFPDAPNHPEFPSTLLQTGETYVNWITLDFEDLSAEDLSASTLQPLNPSTLKPSKP